MLFMVILDKKQKNYKNPLTNGEESDRIYELSRREVPRRSQVGDLKKFLKKPNFHPSETLTYMKG